MQTVHRRIICYPFFPVPFPGKKRTRRAQELAGVEFTVSCSNYCRWRFMRVRNCLQFVADFLSDFNS